MWIQSAFACGVLMGGGFEDLRHIPVSMADEETLIIWNSQQQTQDFIRRVSFQTTIDDFALLVPVPSRPQVSEFDDAIFATLQEEMERQRPVERNWIFPWSSWLAGNMIDGTLGGGFGGGELRSEPGGVHIVEELNVGLFRAQVLTADNSQDLDEWLQNEGFSMGGHAQDYLQHYIGGSWHWVVLRHLGETQGNVQTQTFGLRFETPTPFYPYREPMLDDETLMNSPIHSRTLRLYLLSDKPLQAHFDKNQGKWPKNYAGSLEIFSAPVRHLSQPIRKASSFDQNQQLHLTHYTETLMPRSHNPQFAKRADHDLYWMPSKAGEARLLPARRKTIDTTPYFLAGVVSLFLMGAFLAIKRLRRA